MTQSELISVEKIKENDWRQGCVFPKEAIPRIAEAHFPGIDLSDVQIIVISQSCDIRYYKADEELWIEVLLARSIPKEDKGAIQGRRQRCYHLKICDKTCGNTSWYEAVIDDRYKIKRNFCADYKPSPQWYLHDDEIRSVVQWIAYRYVRPAFPDAFNERIRHKKNALKKLLKNESSQFLSGIYMQISDEELPSDQPYEIKIVGAMTKDHYSNTNKRKTAENHILEFENIIGDCDGIDASSECLSEEDISLDTMRQFLRFTDYDYLSYDSETDTYIS